MPGSQLIYYLLKMSSGIKIHDCATHYVLFFFFFFYNPSTSFLGSEGTTEGRREGELHMGWGGGSIGIDVMVVVVGDEEEEEVEEEEEAKEK